MVLPVLALVGYSGFLSSTLVWRTLQTKWATEHVVHLPRPASLTRVCRGADLASERRLGR